MRIGDLAAKTGVSARSLRYYEQQHLLASDRSPSGQRHYPGGAAERVRLIQQFYAAGLTSKLIKQLLPCFGTGEVKTELLDVLMAERERIDKQTASLLCTRDSLDSLINAAARARQEGQPAFWVTQPRSEPEGRHRELDVPRHRDAPAR